LETESRVWETGREYGWIGVVLIWAAKTRSICEIGFACIVVSSRIGLSMFSVSRAGNFPKQPERGGLGSGQTGRPRNRLSMFSGSSFRFLKNTPCW
jgi:hypothetical protein